MARLKTAGIVVSVVVVVFFETVLVVVEVECSMKVWSVENGVFGLDGDFVIFVEESSNMTVFKRTKNTW